VGCIVSKVQGATNRYFSDMGMGSRQSQAQQEKLDCERRVGALVPRK